MSNCWLARLGGGGALLAVTIEDVAPCRQLLELANDAIPIWTAQLGLSEVGVDWAVWVLVDK